MNSIRIVLADDHAVVRSGLKALIAAEPGLEVVGEAASGEAALEQVQLHQPDLLVLDVAMPGLNGVETMQVMRRWDTPTRVLVLTAFDDLAYLRQLLAMGAAGFLLKTSAPENLVAALRTVAQGGTFLDAAVAHYVVSGYLDHHLSPSSADGSGSELTPREREVLIALAHGFTNKEIAAQIAVSVKTVEAHKANGMAKLRLHSRAELVRYALRHSWLGASIQQPAGALTSNSVKHPG